MAIIEEHIPLGPDPKDRRLKITDYEPFRYAICYRN